MFDSTSFIPPNSVSRALCCCSSLKRSTRNFTQSASSRGPTETQSDRRAMMLRHESEIAHGEVSHRREERVQLCIRSAEPPRHSGAVLTERDTRKQHPPIVREVVVSRVEVCV